MSDVLSMAGKKNQGNSQNIIIYYVPPLQPTRSESLFSCVVAKKKGMQNSLPL
jgi:hypothetical protein